METKIDIISYATFKKRYNPTIYEVWDGVKGWARQTVTPTLSHHGWLPCTQEYDYGLSAAHNRENEKPKDMAKRLLLKEWGENWCKDKKFVYYLYEGTNGYMDVLYVYWKYKDEPNIKD